MTEPSWLTEARACIGEAEIPGPSSNSWIRDLWHRLKGGAWFWKHYGSDDSLLPWCGAFVAYCLQEAGLGYPQRYASARAWLDWGTKLVTPVQGCIVVFERPGGGHVGFVAGRDKRTRDLLVLGGNQSDRVSIMRFDSRRILGFRWPPGVQVPAPFQQPIPIIAATGEPLSTNEA